MRTVGQRRRDAEEKLEHHLQEARHKDEPHPDEVPEPGAGRVDGQDVADIQDDETLSAADRVDMIANQVVTKGAATPDDKCAGAALPLEVRPRMVLVELRCFGRCPWRRWRGL
jgi:hypothetical protein